MKKLIDFVAICSVLALLLVIAPAPILAQEIGCESDVTVQLPLMTLTRPLIIRT